MSRIVFEKYQPSGMDTDKWYLLDHMTGAICKTGRIEYLRRGPYEGAHKILKFLYEKSSRRRRSAPKETIHRYNGKLYLNNILVTEELAACPQNYCKLFSFTRNSGMVVSVGTKTALAEPESILPALLYLRQCFTDLAKAYSSIHQLGVSLREDAF